MRFADGPPLDPSSGQARDWLVEELRKAPYQDQRSLFDRLVDWLNRQLTRGSEVGAPTEVLWVVLFVIIAAIIALIVWQMRREPATSRSGDDHDVLGGSEHTAAEHRELARAAMTASDWNTAVIEGYRAIARGAAERTILPDLPGLTAHEVAIALASAFPAEGSELATAADIFDAVRYGDDRADAAAAERLLALEARLLTARPALSPLGLLPTPGAGGTR
ncbi:DUF4129 domain-containing protein [Janibacter sp. GXQ6167]|uniref:DUF4129 domain-containing protein n=1 Tax=Janibacter sp. GXQ6167 TaxID=3240791 RepID=UPI0035269F0C